MSETANTRRRTRVVAAAGLLLVAHVCAAADRADSREWSATLACGPVVNAPEKWPPFKWTVPLVVSNGKATLTRDTSRQQETLSGTIADDGAVILEGGGSLKAERSGPPWRYRLEGRFTGDKLESAGSLLNPDGSRKIRDCTLTATRQKDEAEVKAGAEGQTSAQNRRELVQLYQRTFRPDDAIPHLKETLAEVVQKTPDSLAEAAVRLSLAKQLRAAGRSPEAMEHVVVALRIYERDAGSNDARTHDANITVGWVQTNIGQVNEAIDRLETAIQFGEKRFGQQHRPTAWANVPLGFAYRVSGRLADSERVLLKALKFYERDNETSTDYAAVLGDLAMTYQVMGRLNDAERYAQQSLTFYLNRAGPQWPTTIVRMRTLSEILLDQRRNTEAVKIAERAAEYGEQYHKGTVLHANVLSDLGRVYQRTQQYDRAEETLRRAEQVLAATPAAKSLAMWAIRQRLAGTMIPRERFDEAKALFLQVREDYKSARSQQGMAFNSVGLGRAELGLKNYAAATQYLLEAVKLFTELKGAEHPDTLATQRALADAYLAQGQIQPAVQNYRAVMKQLEGYLAQRKSQSPAGRAEQEANLRGLLGQYLGVLLQAQSDRLADGTDRVQEAFSIAEQLRNRATQSAILGMSARAAANDPELAQLARREQDLRMERGGVEMQINEGLSTTRGDGMLPSQDLIRRRNTIDAELARINSRIAQQFPKYAQLLNPSSPTLASLRSALAPDAAILSYVVRKERTLLWSITRDKATLHVIPISATDLEARVKHIRRSLDADVATLNDVHPYDAAAAHELYKLLVGPAAADIAGRPNLVVIPHGPLFSLPFAALVAAPAATPRPRDFAPYATVPWLGTTHTIAVVPSAAAFATLRSAVRTVAAERPFVGFGDPVFQPASTTVATTVQRSLRDTRDLQKLSALPETNEELRLIAKALRAGDSDLYLGARATELNVKRAELSRYRVIAFATHGLIAGDVEGLDEPALALTPPAKASADDDGLLTMSEVLGLKLNADWVVLSACNTASSDGSLHGDGLSGLTQAFFYAGSRALLVTLWPVESSSAQTLTTSLFAAVRDKPKLLRTEALATAQRAMMQGKAGKAEYAHPFFWAPFILVGDGGSN